MNKTYTLKELVDIGAKAGYTWERDWNTSPHEAFTKAILDAIGYEFPKDEEREAFDDWWKANRIAYCNEEHAFQLWKAGRKELLKTQALAKEPDTKTEPPWIPWPGGDKSPITGSQTKFEVECRDGVKAICNKDRHRWSHNGVFSDIIAYRILEP